MSVRPVIPLKVRSGKKMEWRKGNRKWNGGKRGRMESGERRWGKETEKKMGEREGGVVEYVYVCVVNELISCLLSFFSFFLFISRGSGFILVGL